MENFKFKKLPRINLKLVAFSLLTCIMLFSAFEMGKYTLAFVMTFIMGVFFDKELREAK